MNSDDGSDYTPSPETGQWDAVNAYRPSAAEMKAASEVFHESLVGDCNGEYCQELVRGILEAAKQARLKEQAAEDERFPFSLAPRSSCTMCDQEPCTCFTHSLSVEPPFGGGASVAVCKCGWSAVADYPHTTTQLYAAHVAQVVVEGKSEWGSCIRCGREDEHGEFVELMGAAKTPDDPDGGTGESICPECIANIEATTMTCGKMIRSGRSPLYCDMPFGHEGECWAQNLR